jgi:hypothetical protein
MAVWVPGGTVIKDAKTYAVRRIALDADTTTLASGERAITSGSVACAFHQNHGHRRADP